MERDNVLSMEPQAHGTTPTIKQIHGFQAWKPIWFKVPSYKNAPTSSYTSTRATTLGSISPSWGMFDSVEQPRKVVDMLQQ